MVRRHHSWRQYHQDSQSVFIIFFTRPLAVSFCLANDGIVLFLLGFINGLDYLYQGMRIHPSDLLLVIPSSSSSMPISPLLGSRVHRHWWQLSGLTLVCYIYIYIYIKTKSSRWKQNDFPQRAGGHGSASARGWWMLWNICWGCSSAIVSSKFWKLQTSKSHIITSLYPFLLYFHTIPLWGETESKDKRGSGDWAKKILVVTTAISS